MPPAIIVVLRSVWGWSVRVPYASVGGSSYLLPPPTTLVGALAESYALLNNLPEVIPARGSARSRVKSYTLASTAASVATMISDVYAGLLKGAVVRAVDMMRALNVPYLKKEHQKEPNQWFGLGALGVTLAPNSLLLVVYLLRDDAKARELYEAAWGIARLGSKEGLVSVECVDLVDAIEEDRVEAEIPVYTRLDSLKPEARQGLLGEYVVEEMPVPTPDFWLGRGTVAKYLLPLRETLPDVYLPEHILCENRCSVYKLEPSNNLCRGLVGDEVLVPRV